MRIAALGLGRMGTAMVTRLAERDREVAGWTRSGGGHPGDAVAEADVVLLALFDGEACHQVIEAVLEPLRAYIRGHATGDPAHFRDAFLPTAHIEGLRDGVFVSWDLDEYCGLFPGRPAADEPARTRRIDAVDVHGTIATASMTLRHGADTFTDTFLLIRIDKRWRIANKTYHRETSTVVA
ncbi:hypothetical protein BJ973_004334 [Actinoplanes tereljensis]|nr:nuclear transport factor 2 family protein [Actinoplanes tereljensis]